MTITREQALEEAMRLFNPSGHVFTETVPPKPKSKSKSGRDAANAAEALARMSRRRREHAEKLENLRGWVEHYGALSLAAHDQAARYAEKRDEALALLKELETTNGGTAA